LPAILLVEDDYNTCFGLGEILASEGYDVVLAEDADEALEKVDRETDLVLTDLQLPGMSGLEMLNQMRQQYPELLSIIMTAFSTPETKLQAEESGVFSFLNKPLNIDHLLSAMENAVHQNELKEQLIFDEVTVIES